MSQITVRCPECGNEAQAQTSVVGRVVCCRRCQKPFTVPLSEPLSAQISSMLANTPSVLAKIASVLAKIASVLGSLSGEAWWAITVAVVIGSTLLYLKIDSARQQRTVRKANELFAAGKRNEAVTLYKAQFGAFDQKAEVLKRIVEFEIEQGNTDEAAKWIGHGLDSGLGVKYDQAAAEALVDRIKRERADRQREREAEARKQEEDRKAKPEAKSPPKSEITSSELLGEFQANGSQARSKYAGRHLKVEGRINEIFFEEAGFPEIAIALEPSSEKGEVQCIFSPRLKGQLQGLRKGQMIAVSGRCDDAGWPVAKVVKIVDCRLER